MGKVGKNPESTPIRLRQIRNRFRKVGPRYNIRSRSVLFGIVRNRLESSGIARSRPESFGVVRSRSIYCPAWRSTAFGLEYNHNEIINLPLLLLDFVSVVMVVVVLGHSRINNRMMAKRNVSCHDVDACFISLSCSVVGVNKPIFG